MRRVLARAGRLRLARASVRAARRLGIGAALACCALQAWAGTAHLFYDWPAGRPTTGAQVEIDAVSMAGAEASAAPVRSESGLDGAVLNLGEGVWLVQVFMAGYWSQGAAVTVNGQAPASVRIAFWPAATLRGEIAPAEGESLPKMLSVKLSTHPAAGAPGDAAKAEPQEPRPASAILVCPIETGGPNGTGRWKCMGPAGLFDARLEVEGYAPRYAWGVRLTAGASVDLGATELRRFLSVSGRAVRKDGSVPAGPCQATLRPDAERGGGPDAESRNAPPEEKTFAVSLNPQGFFQIVGVMPGNHALSVECPEASGFTLLNVQPSGETKVDSPLTLEELPLEVVLSPRTDPSGQPWRVTLDATAPRLRRIAATVTATADGRWTRHGLMAGTYRIAVRSADGMEWLRKDFDLRPGAGPLVLHLAAVRVAGTVLLNGQPVCARLLFSNEDGGDPVPLQSDEGGHFAGRLPIAAGVPDSVWAVEAHVKRPETVRRLTGIDVPTVAAGSSAWLDLELPSMPVRGIVVSEDGKPQSDAQVTFKSARSGYQVTVTSDETGSFEAADLPAGMYEASAESSRGRADPVPLAIEEGAESRLKMILHPNLHIPFHVLSKDGEPIEDATVQVWIPPGVPQALGRTDREGRFEATLPPGTTEVALTVSAADYALRMVKIPVSSTTGSGGTGSPADQNAVTLDTNGGSLTLNFEPAEGALDRSATLVLLHQNALVDARTLPGWGTDQAGGNASGPAEVDEIEPGDYALCVLTDPSQLAALWQGDAPPERCSVGTVKSGQLLTLTPH